MMKKILFFFLLFVFVLNAETPRYSDVNAEVAKDMIDDHDDLIVIDVSSNYVIGHIPGSVNYGFSDNFFDKMIKVLSSTGKYLIYCHTDEASIRAANMLTDAGFRHVWRLDGNYAAWKDAGYSTEDGLNYVDISARIAKSMKDNLTELIIVDVSPMYEQGHIPGAVNYPIATLSESISGLDKTKPYLIYCHKDDPSINGSKIFIKNGFQHVFRLDGNFKAWADAGYEIE